MGPGRALSLMVSTDAWLLSRSAIVLVRLSLYMTSKAPLHAPETSSW